MRKERNLSFAAPGRFFFEAPGVPGFSASSPPLHEVISLRENKTKQTFFKAVSWHVNCPCEHCRYKIWGFTMTPTEKLLLTKHVLLWGSCIALHLPEAVSGCVVCKACGWGGLNNRSLFSHSSRGRKHGARCHQGWSALRPLSVPCGLLPSRCVLTQPFSGCAILVPVPLP